MNITISTDINNSTSNILSDDDFTFEKLKYLILFVLVSISPFIVCFLICGIKWKRETDSEMLIANSNI